MLKSGESQTPQFATAEYAANAPTLKCAACKQPIDGSYFQIKGAPVCPGCTERIRAQIPQDTHAAFIRALVLGIAGALVGLALYVIFALSTGLVIGWASVAVGYIVGKAMHIGSRVGLRFAWQFTASRWAKVSGPYTVAATGGG